MKILYFIFYIIDHSVCDQLLPSEMKSENVFDNVLQKNVFLKKATLDFWTRRLSSFHNVIFNQWGQLSAGLTKEFFTVTS